MIVTPAQAGVHRSPARAPDRWLPAFAGMTQEETYVILEPDPDDLARVKQWFHRLSERVRAVDFTGAHPLFAEDMIAFGTFENFITGRDRAEAAQWRNQRFLFRRQRHPGNRGPRLPGLARSGDPNRPRLGPALCRRLHEKSQFYQCLGAERRPDK